MLTKHAMKKGLWPLALLWLAAHAAILAVILCVKFLTAKTMAVLLVAAAAFWFFTGRKARPALPAPLAKDARAA